MIENTNEQELIKNTLLKFFPEECSIAGGSTIDKIAAGKAEIVRTQGGKNFDITAILALLVSSATLITHIITICKSLKKEKKPAAGKTIINIQNLTIDHPGISDEMKTSILKYVELEMAKRDNE
jgi:hypothetical protein